MDRKHLRLVVSNEAPQRSLFDDCVRVLGLRDECMLCGSKRITCERISEVELRATCEDCGAEAVIEPNE